MKIGILLVAYGAANQRNSKSLRRFQAQVEQRFALPARWAFSSNLNRLRMAEAKTKSDSVSKALLRMAYDGYTDIVVQSLHLAQGLEFESMLEQIAAVDWPATAPRLAVGLPLLRTERDLPQLSACLRQVLPPERLPEQPVLLMAHGSPSRAGLLYEKWAHYLEQLDPNLFLTCMECAPLLPQRLARLEQQRPSLVWLLPLLATVGKHSQDDLAGGGADSWLGQILARGLDCEVRVSGLIDNDCFASAWQDRLQKALDDLRLGVQD